MRVVGGPRMQIRFLSVIELVICRREEVVSSLRPNGEGSNALNEAGVSPQWQQPGIRGGRKVCAESESS